FAVEYARSLRQIDLCIFCRCECGFSIRELNQFASVSARAITWSPVSHSCEGTTLKCAVPSRLNFTINCLIVSSTGGEFNLRNIIHADSTGYPVYTIDEFIEASFPGVHHTVDMITYAVDDIGKDVFHIVKCLFYAAPYFACDACACAFNIIPFINKIVSDIIENVFRTAAQSIKGIPHTIPKFIYDACDSVSNRIPNIGQPVTQSVANIPRHSAKSIPGRVYSIPEILYGICQYRPYAGPQTCK